MKLTIAALILAICVPAATVAQQGEPPEFYSHLSVIVRGYPCTVIAQGAVMDAGGNYWNLPPNTVLPCEVSPKPKRKTIVSMPVETTASLPGSIGAKQGNMSIARGDTAGWISAQSSGMSKPGMSLESQCRTGLDNDQPPTSYRMGDQPEKLVKLLSSDGIDVYTFAIDGVPLSWNGDAPFSNNLYFIFRDENRRQRAIQEINLHAHSDPKNLKYVVMEVAYYPTYLDPSIALPNGESVSGPVLFVHDSEYVEPLRCTSSSYREMGNKAGIGDLIMINGPGTSSPTVIGEEWGFLDACTNCARWGLFAGDLESIKTVGGYAIIKINQKQTPFLFRTIRAMEEYMKAKTIGEGRTQ